MSSIETLPVAIIGAGPVGLAAAAHLIQRGYAVKVYEAGATIAANVRDWGHIRLFSPWEYNTDTAARKLLGAYGWQAPPAKGMPTGGELYEAYLKPLAATPEMAAAIETNATVTAITRYRTDKMVSKGRETKPFVLAISHRNGELRRDLARAVIDASGTWTSPNPLGAGGIPAAGEGSHSDRTAYGIPDVLGRDRAAYQGKKVVVVGAGHSAANVLLDLAALKDADSATEIVWATRGTDLKRVFGGGRADQLPARGELGYRLKTLVDEGRVGLVTGFSIAQVKSADGRLVLVGETAAGIRELGQLDRIVAATGQRPDLSLTREIRIDLDPWLESSRALGPSIDPNLHSCGSVPPHGHRELSHPEPGFYSVGIKSYGRAPTFLLLTGYEQVRSVVAAIDGDFAAANDIHLILPETGVCSTDLREDGTVGASGCCGVPAPAPAVEVRAQPETIGCCGPAPAPPAPRDDVKSSSCCTAPAPAVEVRREPAPASGCGCGPAPSAPETPSSAGCCTAPAV